MVSSVTYSNYYLFRYNINASPIKNILLWINNPISNYPLRWFNIYSLFIAQASSSNGASLPSGSSPGGLEYPYNLLNQALDDDIGNVIVDAVDHDFQIKEIYSTDSLGISFALLVSMPVLFWHVCLSHIF